MTESKVVTPVPRMSDFDRKTIALTADFIESALDDASILDGIPSGAMLVLLPDDDSDFSEESIAVGIAAVRQGWDVVFRHVPDSGARQRLNNLPE